MTRRRRWWQPRRSRRAQRWALAVVVGSLAGAGFAAHGAYRNLLEYPERPTSRLATEVSMEIPSGTPFPRVLDLMVEAGVLASDDVGYFRMFVLHKGADRKVTAGPHTFRPEMTPTELLEELMRRQRAEEIRVTIPEGRNMLQVVEILANAGLGTAEELEAAMRDRELLDELKITGPTAEGYLFPDTYKFKRGAEPATVVARLVRRHRQVYSDLRRRHRHAAEKLGDGLGFSDGDIVTLASIVEKETAARHERPIIAGVFLNRLRFKSFQPKKLETDPTIIYGCTVPEKKSAACEKFEGRIRRIHLRDTDNPYNTYQIEGLPPGPISNPGRAALEAVLAPKSTRFLYFVARNDGTHQFSKTIAEHEKWVDLYQRKGAVGDGSQSGAVDN